MSIKGTRAGELYPVDADGFKVCSKCKRRKLADLAFEWLPAGRYRAQCKACRAEKLKEWRHKNRPSESQLFYEEALRVLFEDD